MKMATLFRSGLWITYATFINRAFVFLSSLVLARLLQPADFGVIGVVYIFWSFFTLFTQSSAGTFIIYKGVDNPKYINTAYTVSLLVGCVLAVGMVLSAPLIAQFFNEPALTWLLIAFSANLVLSAAAYAYSAVLTRQMKYRELATVSLVNSVCRLVVTTGAALGGLSYWSFVIGDIVSWIVQCVLTRYYTKHPFRLRLDPEVRREVFSFCWGAVGSSLGMYSIFNLDNFTVVKMLGSTSLGYYNLAYQLTMALSTILNPVLDQLGMPTFSKLTDEQAQQTALHRVVESIALLSAPIYALIFLMLDPSVVTFLFSEKWVPICTVFPGLLLFAYFRVVNLPLRAMLVAKGRPDVNAKVNLFVAPIAIASFILGAQRGGIVGVSVAVALVLGFGWTILWWWMGCYHLNWSLKRFLQPGFLPMLLVLPGTLVAWNLPLWWRPVVLLVTYLVAVRCLLPAVFKVYYKSFVQAIGHLREIAPFP